MRTLRLRTSVVVVVGGMHEIGNVRQSMNAREKEKEKETERRHQFLPNPLPRRGDGRPSAAC